MSVRRVFHWLCDGCAASSAVEHYGGPPGWTWRYAGGKITHACPVCTSALLAAGAKRHPEDAKRLLP